jgi:hypothetical protein
MPTRDEKRRQDFEESKGEEKKFNPVTVDIKSGMEKPVRGLPKARP